MSRLLKGSVAALALAGTVVAAAPADARYYGHGYGGRGYYGGHYYHGGRTGLALGAGALGLAAGLAIADRPHYGYGYYGGPGYAYGYGYAPPPPGYYYEGYEGYCHSDWRWDGYRGRYVRVRYCD